MEERVEGVGDMATFRSLYDDASKVAGTLWESAAVEGKPDADAARGIVDSLAQAVAQNRTALLALTALKNYDNYTFTHMVNVSILTMGQARGLGIDGPLLREFGLAALMHDIGKVKTPSEILNKPGKLTDAEFEILQAPHRGRRRDPEEHARDSGARRRSSPSSTTCAATAPAIRSASCGRQLNLGTTLCGIADVYDAMRSQRVYQQAYPTDRILAVLQRNDGKQFDQHLVRRFVAAGRHLPGGQPGPAGHRRNRRRAQAYAPDPVSAAREGADSRAGGRSSSVRTSSTCGTRPRASRRSVQAPVDPADVRTSTRCPISRP